MPVKLFSILIGATLKGKNTLHKWSIFPLTEAPIKMWISWVKSSELLVKLELEDLDLILIERRLRCFGHVERSSGAVRTASDTQIDGRRGAGRPKLTWKKL